MLQARRHTDFVVDFGCRSVDEYREEHGADDPAAKDAELAAKLNENAKVSGEAVISAVHLPLLKFISTRMMHGAYGPVRITIGLAQ